MQRKPAPGPLTFSPSRLYSIQSSTLDSWRTNHFGSAANSGDGADFADPDKDGMVNVMEFATGQHPTIPSAGPLRIERDGDELAFVYPRSLESIDEVLLHLEWSEGLQGPWRAEDVTESVIDEDDAIQWLRAMPETPGRMGFVRLRASPITGPEIDGVGEVLRNAE